jgi:hypothetical protein
VLYKGIPLHENFGNCVIIATKVRWNIKVFVVDRISVFSDEGSLRNQSILVKPLNSSDIIGPEPSLPRR